MTSPVQIRKPEAVDRVRRLSKLRGKPLTEAVDEVVTEKLKQMDGVEEADRARWIADINRIVDEFNALPIVGPLLTDDDLYDEFGLPK